MSDKSNCIGCEYLDEDDGEKVCNDSNFWPGGVPENPPCFRNSPEARRAAFVVIDGGKSKPRIAAGLNAINRDK